MFTLQINSPRMRRGPRFPSAARGLGSPERQRHGALRRLSRAPGCCCVISSARRLPAQHLPAQPSPGTPRPCPSTSGECSSGDAGGPERLAGSPRAPNGIAQRGSRRCSVTHGCDTGQVQYCHQMCCHLQNLIPSPGVPSAGDCSQSKPCRVQADPAHSPLESCKSRQGRRGSD